VIVSSRPTPGAAHLVLVDIDGLLIRGRVTITVEEAAALVEHLVANEDVRRAMGAV
jgi:ribonucleotide monophosphatase NagD (HAD superfamily)